MERLLNEQEIKGILRNEYNNPVFKYYGIRLMAIDKHSFNEVIAISDKNNLILIKGNEDTGDMHIRERHNFWSLKKYIITNKEGGLTFQNQSKFPMNIAPIDYLKIADEIFLKENLIEDNPHEMADKFDLYIGEYQFEEQKKERVKLLLYKGTKIIHSLFLVSSKYNSKRVSKFPFTRGQVSLRVKKGKNVDEIFIPYLDTNLKLRFGISIEKYPSQDLEHIYLLIFNTKDYSHHNFIKLLERKLTVLPSKKHEEISYQYCDLRDIENYIIFINEGIEKGMINLGKQ